MVVFNEIGPKVSSDMNDLLSGDVREDDIKAAVFQLGASKTPSLNGFLGCILSEILAYC